MKRVKRQAIFLLMVFPLLSPSSLEAKRCSRECQRTALDPNASPMTVIFVDEQVASKIESGEDKELYSQIQRILGQDENENMMYALSGSDRMGKGVEEQLKELEESRCGTVSRVIIFDPIRSAPGELWADAAGTRTRNVIDPTNVSNAFKKRNCAFKAFPAIELHGNMTGYGCNGAVLLNQVARSFPDTHHGVIVSANTTTLIGGGMVPGNSQQYRANFHTRRTPLQSEGETSEQFVLANANGEMISTDAPKKICEGTTSMQDARSGIQSIRRELDNSTCSLPYTKLLRDMEKGLDKYEELSRKVFDREGNFVEGKDKDIRKLYKDAATPDDAILFANMAREACQMQRDIRPTEENSQATDR